VTPLVLIPQAAYPPGCFLKVSQFKEVKVLCFDTLLQLFIPDELQTVCSYQVVTQATDFHFEMRYQLDES
jgi:hypothetical protein